MKFWKIIITENGEEKTYGLAAPKSMLKPEIKKTLKVVYPEWGKFRMLRGKKPDSWCIFLD